MTKKEKLTQKMATKKFFQEIEKRINHNKKEGKINEYVSVERIHKVQKLAEQKTDNPNLKKSFSENKKFWEQTICNFLMSKNKELQETGKTDDQIDEEISEMFAKYGTLY